MHRQRSHPIEELSRVIELIYGCVLDPRRWWTTLPALCALTNSAAAVLSLGDGRARCIFHHGYEPHVSLDEEHLASITSALPELAFCVGKRFSQGALPDAVKFQNSRFYKEWCQPKGLRDALGTVARSGSCEIVLILNRLENQPDYGGRETRLLRLLVPHICEALRMAEVVGLHTARSDALDATLDTLSAGLYITDRQGHVIFMNDAAKCQVKAGNVLRIADNRLSPASAEARDALGRAIATACSDSTGPRVASIALPAQKNGGLGFIATALTLNRDQRQRLAMPFVPVCAVFVQNPLIAPSVPSEAFAKLFGLTPAELDVLSTLAAGRAPQEVADQLDIALSTVKSHLHKIFEKTGTLRQPDLVRLLMGSSLQIALSMRAAVPDRSHSNLHAGVERHPKIPNPAQRAILRAEVPTQALQVAQASIANPTIATGSVAVSVGGDPNARTSVSSLNGRLSSRFPQL